jgi:hypothetical protein
MNEKKNDFYQLAESNTSITLDILRAEGVVLAWGFAVFYIFLMQVIVPGYREAFELFGQILNRSAPSPYAYRVLVPLLIKALGTPLSGFLKPQTSFLVGYCIYCLAAIEYSVAVLFRMLRLWFDAKSALFGIAMYCLMFAVAARHEYFQPWSLIETGFYAGAIILGIRRHFGWALILTVVAALNRETGLFVALLFFAALPGDWFDRKRILYLAALLGVWLVIFYGLRVTIGPRPAVDTISTCLHDNLMPTSMALTLTASAAFFAIGMPAVLGWGSAPREIRRSTVILLLYAPLMILYGRWWEVRHWLPLACLLLPFAIGGIQAIVSSPSYSTPPLKESP